MNKETAPCGGLTFFCLLFLCQDKKRRKNDKKSALNFHLPNMSEKPILAKPSLPRPPTDKENAPCGGLTFFCLLSPSQDKKRRKRQKKNVPNFHLPNDSEKPILIKTTLPRLPTDKENAPCGGLTFFCLLSPSQDKKRRKRQKKNVPNFHLPNMSEKPILIKTTIPRVPSQVILIKYSNPRPSGIPVLGRFPNPNASA